MGKFLHKNWTSAVSDIAPQTYNIMTVMIHSFYKPLLSTENSKYNKEEGALVGHMHLILKIALFGPVGLQGNLAKESLSSLQLCFK